MAAESITLSTTLESAATADEALAELRQLPRGPSARLDEPDGTTLHLSSGSTLRYRLLGAWSGSEHLPLMATFQLAPHRGGTSVRVTLASATGWYLVQTSLGRDACRARFDSLIAAMQADGIDQRTQDRRRLALMAPCGRRHGQGAVVDVVDCLMAC
ncbi:hypothetical protein GTQ99_09915 [Kineococcus sp. T13]|uniref:hypothetical protein n=1 Tax=Kineococcus vitellinus TaxID=2696565 RepID=UPI00141200D9|nr:hypothetical protein [Kineococcus vitellinus]NAZ75726.1 hypothetical protein [Kineococcus vitellinus]